MSARYSVPKVHADGLRLAVAFDIENTSGESWRGSDLRIGYQVFDPETDALLVDGARTPVGEDRAHVEIIFDMPFAPGRYRVVVSPMRENAAWFYEKGWRFLAIDAAVAGGVCAVERVRVITLRTVRGERMLRSSGRLLTWPWLAVWRHRGLIRTMVRRDLLSRYRGSFGGRWWTLLTPLLLMLTYYFVFGVVLETRFEADPSRSGFVLYFFAGMLPWLAFSEAAARAPTVIWEHRNFVKKLVFPVETLPVNLVAAGLVSELVMIVLFVGGLIIARGQAPATLWWLPLIVAPQVLFTLGVCWFLAALGVFVRDLGQVIGFLLTLWFFLTPICYPQAQMPAAAMAILSSNPIFVLVRLYRGVLLEGHSPGAQSLAGFWILSAAVFLSGYAWFYKLRRSFADLM
ncbi:MAG TPA: ABC transporter permease [Bryobacteraceae bacterium]|nr:ABC transporter permease [Bryobacteraceae bacterium]